MRRILLTAALLTLATDAYAQRVEPVPVAVAASGVFRCGAGDQAAAITTALAAGGRLQIGPGTCLLGTSIRMPSFSVLTGAGAGSTILKAMPGSSINLIEIGPGPGAAAGAQPTTRVEVSGLTLDGSANVGSAVPKGASGIMVWPAADGLRLHNLEITANGNGGIYMMGHDASIFDNRIHDNWHNGIYVSGIARRPAGPATISGNIVQHNSLERAPGYAKTHPGQPAWDGIDCGPNHTGCVITGNSVDRNDIIVRDAGTAHSNGWSGQDKVIGNTITNSNQSCIDVAARIDTFEVIRNRVSNCSLDAIVVVGAAQNGTVSGNEVTGAARVGIAIRGVGRNISVTGNTVTGAGRAAYYVHGTSNVTLQGNIGAPVDTARAGAGLSVQ